MDKLFRKKKIQARDNEQMLESQEEVKLRAAKKPDEWIPYITGVIEDTCHSLFPDNLTKLRELQEDEIQEVCKAKAAKIVEIIENEVPDLKIAAHVVIGHIGEQGYHGAVDAFYEVGRDVVHCVIDKDDKFFIEANVVIIPIKLPERFEKRY